MAIPSRVEEFLAQHGARYDVVPHPASRTSIETAELAHVPGDRLVKGVLLEDDEGALLAVLPATRSIQMSHRSAPPTGCARSSTMSSRRNRRCTSKRGTTKTSCT